MAGVYDYETFWNELDIDSGEIVSAYYSLDKYSDMKAKKFDWYDVGTVDNYIKAKKLFKNSKVYSIPKTNGEFLYKVNDRFIKLSSDENFIEQRIKRADNLGGLTPKLNYKGKNLYSYDWVNGEVFYDYNNLKTWERFLDFANKNLWKEINVDYDFSAICKKFYYDKTMSRVKLFLENRDYDFTGDHIVNGTQTHSINELLEVFDWDRVFDGIPTNSFHGDFHFDHIVYDGSENFYLLDWRQNFGGSDVGDVYYDLAKMYGGILMSYKLMKKEENFSCFVDQNIVNYDHKSEPILNEFKPIYERWIQDNNYDLDKIKLITSIIFLNMAPLHETEFGNLLFFKSKQMLHEIK